MKTQNFKSAKGWFIFSLLLPFFIASCTVLEEPFKELSDLKMAELNNAIANMEVFMYKKGQVAPGDEEKIARLREAFKCGPEGVLQQEELDLWDVTLQQTISGVYFGGPRTPWANQVVLEAIIRQDVKNGAGGFAAYQTPTLQVRNVIKHTIKTSFAIEMYDREGTEMFSGKYTLRMNPGETIAIGEAQGVASNILRLGYNFDIVSLSVYDTVEDQINSSH